MIQYALFGQNIAHSLSPRIHQLFAQQAKLPMEYTIIDVRPQDFCARWSAFIAAGGRGANFTTPYKEILCAQVDKLSLAALSAGAINTLIITKEKTVHGDNTDGIGLINDLQRNKIEIKNRRVLILGAGGAVRGILRPLLALKPQQIIIVNRNLTRAKNLVEKFGKQGLIYAVDYDDFATINADIIIHATSTTLPCKTAMQKLNFTGATCYDLQYSSTVTPFLKFAYERGAVRVQNGLGMLVEQAAASFKLWHDYMPDVKHTLLQLQQFAVHIPAFDGL